MCYSCNTKGYFSSRCKDGRGPTTERRTDELEMMARPARNYGPAIPSREVSRLPSDLEARASSSSRSSRPVSSRPVSNQPVSSRTVSGRPVSSQASSSRASSSRASSSRASSRPEAQTNVQYEPSIMSVDSQEALANSLMSFRFEIKDMGERIEHLIALRKRQSHKQKKIDPAEYEQALNSPSMIVLYEAYKQAVEYCKQCKDAYDQRMVQHSRRIHYASKEEQMEIYLLQEKYVRAAVNTAEQRLNYLEQFPRAYQNKQSIRGHIEAAEGSMNAALGALKDIDMNKRDIQQACDIATETYAKKILNWPNGRLEKPEIFKFESSGEMRDLGGCMQRFVSHHDEFEASPPNDLPTNPHALVVMDENCLKADETATMALVHKPDNKWRV
ncbi:hypothetical protein FGADI_3481 [Fusarium gaditjirri]|uniref:Uncharacterized protein n=1 Tax=Fusarium gaditjirri TaxID=282569 RepID=A0A8H4TF84_9HYPO|nr:hypothetical protein FGADI_3481 [Fusarium gaditjirri]